jgi:hypothetical protein
LDPKRFTESIFSKSSISFKDLLDDSSFLDLSDFSVKSVTAKHKHDRKDVHLYDIRSDKTASLSIAFVPHNKKVSTIGRLLLNAKVYAHQISKPDHTLK